MSIKALIWDLEGVLLISDIGSVEQIIQKRLDVTRAAIGDFFHSEFNDRVDKGEFTQEQYWLKLLDNLGLPHDNLSIINKHFYSDLYIDPDLLRRIKEYKKKYKTALLSNYSDVLRPLLNTQWRVDNAFDEIIISWEVKLVKPDPRIFDLTLQRLGVEKEEAVLIDDREVNIIGARKYGIHAVIFKNKEQAIEDLEKILA
ncbi:MAG: HAD family phosphatase [Chloroflexi bacterium]|nr:HAD family phosphatase [Chloroflexota bacterium]